MRNYKLFIDTGEDVIKVDVLAKSHKGARFKAYSMGYDKDKQPIIKVVEGSKVELPLDKILALIANAKETDKAGNVIQVTTKDETGKEVKTDKALLTSQEMELFKAVLMELDTEDETETENGNGNVTKK